MRKREKTRTKQSATGREWGRVVEGSTRRHKTYTAGGVATSYISCIRRRRIRVHTTRCDHAHAFPSLSIFAVHLFCTIDPPSPLPPFFPILPLFLLLPPPPAFRCSPAFLSLGSPFSACLLLAFLTFFLSVFLHFVIFAEFRYSMASPPP